MFATRKAGMTAIFTVVVAALFLIPLAGIANADTSNILGTGGGQYNYSYHGKIVAIDKSAGTLTVQTGMNDSRVFSLVKGATITKCDMSEPLESLKVGDEVTVSYFQNGANEFIAGSVNLTLPAGEHC